MSARAGRHIVFFLIGCTGYPLIEILWRGYTHISMMLAGGICSVILSSICERYLEASLLKKAFFSASAITAVEFMFGIVLNILLKMNVWDYTSQPLNILGQICPMFFLLWGILAFMLIPIVNILNKAMTF